MTMLTRLSPLGSMAREVKKAKSWCRLYHDRRRGELSYFQGQYGEGNRREYFYYIDHQGMLFLDDAKMKNFTSCYKEKNFLRFFFNRLQKNDLGRYAEVFPFLSPCGRERNFVRCDDTPIVFTAVLMQQKGRNSSDPPVFSYNHGDTLLTAPFEPSQICMLPQTGRVYHPADEKLGGYGLIADKISLLWSQEHRFIFGDGEENPPTEFKWGDEVLRLSNELVGKIRTK